MRKLFVPDPKTYVERNLRDAQMQLLAARAAKESWDAQVAMLEKRIARLKGETQ